MFRLCSIVAWSCWNPAISRQDAVVIDGTLGMGGHTEAMLERFSNLTVIGIDRDAQAHAIAAERLARFGIASCLCTPYMTI